MLMCYFLLAQIIITLDKALVWTDARYWQQVEQQLDCNWELMKEGTIDEELDPNDPGLYRALCGRG